MDRYLKYAHLFPELASGFTKEFQLPLATADSQTAILADATAGDALSAAVARLHVGDKVQLEWLQIRVELETKEDDEEDRFRMVEQCQKLVKLGASTEDALLKQFPQPQVMIRKESANAKGSEREQKRGNAPANADSAIAEQDPHTAVSKTKSGSAKGKKKGKKGRTKGR